ncbi:MAG: hypothetical protein IT319_08270 [Anaerolineae bacterium]|nr:hypothetical protein [Anaerolineae bacterium]
MSEKPDDHAAEKQAKRFPSVHERSGKYGKHFSYHHDTTGEHGKRFGTIMMRRENTGKVGNSA